MLKKLVDAERIEMPPSVSDMRGMTWNDCFVIIDEVRDGAHLKPCVRVCGTSRRPCTVVAGSKCE